MLSTARVVNAIRRRAVALAAPKDRPVRVLVVDDEEAIVRFVTRVLGSGGYETCSAAGGTEALRVAAQSGPFDVLLTDLRMPDMNGDELARQLRLAEPNLKVLYFTGFSDQLFTEQRLLWEDEVYLDKPATVRGILEAVALLLKSRSEEPEPSRLATFFHRHEESPR